MPQEKDCSLPRGHTLNHLQVAATAPGPLQ